jgi:ATP-dependent RNA helicase RhlE
MNFNQFNLDSRLNDGIKREGYHAPTPIQLAAIPLALAGHDLIGTAQTGTGKTAAFVLPILHKLLTGPRNRTRALIITPTRELAEQIHQAIGILRGGTNLRSIAIYGGVGAGAQIEALHRGVEIVVACPGRLLDHIQNKHAKLGQLEVLVLDEADRPVHTVAHTLYPVPHHLKRGLVIKLLQQTDTKSVLIFTRTKHRAQRLAKQIAGTGFKVTSLHSKQGRYQIMVATDIAARGLDIDSISHVINYDMPDTADAYIHRIGRTGRAKRTGEAFTLITADDQALVQKIEKIMKQKLPRQTLPLNRITHRLLGNQSRATSEQRLLGHTIAPARSDRLPRP